MPVSSPRPIVMAGRGPRPIVMAVRGPRPIVMPCAARAPSSWPCTARAPSSWPGVARPSTSSPHTETNPMIMAPPLRLQCCATCGTLQYPSRELCASCLADTLEYTDSSNLGEVLATTELHHSHEPAFRSHLPLHVGLVRLDAGPTTVCFLAPNSTPGTRVQVTATIDSTGRQILTAATMPDADPPPATAAAPSR